MLGCRRQSGRPLDRDVNKGFADEVAYRSCAKAEIGEADQQADRGRVHRAVPDCRGDDVAFARPGWLTDGTLLSNNPMSGLSQVTAKPFAIR